MIARATTVTSTRSRHGGHGHGGDDGQNDPTTTTTTTTTRPPRRAVTDRTDRVPSAATVTLGTREPNSLPRRRRRRRAAPAGRVAATGLSASALLGIVGVIGAHASPTGATAKLASTRSIEPTAASARRVAPPTTIVWRVVHRVVVVNDLPPVDGAGHGEAAPRRRRAHRCRRRPTQPRRRHRPRRIRCRARRPRWLRRRRARRRRSPCARDRSARERGRCPLRRASTTRSSGIRFPRWARARSSSSWVVPDRRSSTGRPVDSPSSRRRGARFLPDSERAPSRPTRRRGARRRVGGHGGGRRSRAVVVVRDGRPVRSDDPPRPRGQRLRPHVPIRLARRSGAHGVDAPGTGLRRDPARPRREHGDAPGRCRARPRWRRQGPRRRPRRDRLARPRSARRVRRARRRRASRRAAARTAVPGRSKSRIPSTSRGCFAVGWSRARSSPARRAFAGGRAAAGCCTTSSIPRPVHPRLGASPRSLQTVKTAWWAEGVAKAALVAGVDDGIALLERLGIAAVVVDDRGNRHETTYWTAA